MVPVIIKIIKTTIQYCYLRCSCLIQFSQALFKNDLAVSYPGMFTSS